MSSYNVVFSGQLLEGFDPRDVRMHAGERMRMNGAQLDKVFGGDRVVLKKAVGAAIGERYLAELQRLGMAARLEPSDAPVVEQAPSRFKVVFFGKLVEGFERASVIAAATHRLGVTPEQAAKLFSGVKAVLKRDVSAGTGKRYVDELAGIGMQVVLEADVKPADAARPAVRDAANVAAKAMADANADVMQREAVAEKMRLEQAVDAHATSMTDTLFEMPRALMASGLDVPHEADVQESIDHAATLLVDPMRLVEQLQNLQMSAPPLQAHAASAAAKSPGAFDNTIAYVQCMYCGHRQPQRDRCRRCGAAMTEESAAPAPLPVLEVPSSLSLAPVEPPKAADTDAAVDTPTLPAPTAAPQPAPLPRPVAAHTPPSSRDSLASLRAQADEDADAPAADDRSRKRLMAIVAVAAVILLWILFRH